MVAIMVSLTSLRLCMGIRALYVEHTRILDRHLTCVNSQTTIYFKYSDLTL